MIHPRHRPPCPTAPTRALTLVALALLTLGATADPVERVADAPWGNPGLAIPASGDGQWRERTQLVWDDGAGRLTRRAYRIWDALPASDQEFLWQPDNADSARPGAVTGHGTLLWRHRGAPSYDESATIATYRGELRDGRAQGMGNYRHCSGLSYRGEWQEGLMHGQGRLLMPNGDEYVGGFVHGRRGGEGVYVDAQGNTYRGRFAADLRDGEGTVVGADAVAYSARFRAGTEIAGTRVALPSGQRRGYVFAADYPVVDDVRIGVVVERQLATEDAETVPLSYTSASDGETLRIFPDDPRLLDVWHGRAEIQLTDREEGYHEDIEEMRRKSPIPMALEFDGHLVRFDPLGIIFTLQNRSSQSMRVVGAFLDIADSTAALQPLIRVSTGLLNSCSLPEGVNFKAGFQLENHGWTAAENARVTLTFANADGSRTRGSVTRDLGTLKTAAKVGLDEDLKAAGVQIARLNAKRFSCSSEDNASCERELAASRLLGSLGDLVWLDEDDFYINARGTLDYDWRDAQGALHHQTSPFTARLLVGRKATELECGEGGLPTLVRQQAFNFELGRRDYRVPVPIRGDVAAGATGRWRVKLDAKQSSMHQFRFVLQLADGREVASRPLQLLFVRPANISAHRGK
jgi:hypothetical protein